MNIAFVLGVTVRNFLTHKHKNYLMKRGKTMKKLTKTFMAVAAVSAVSAVMAASAMAMTATYDDAKGEVTLKDVNSTGTSQTLLVLSEDAATITSENVDIVKQIDQKDDSTSFATVPVGSLADGTYYVRIGGNGKIQTATFTVGDVDPGDETEVFKIGNIDNDVSGRINSSDTTALAKWIVKSYDANNETVGNTYNVVSGIDQETIKIGNIDNDVSGRINSSDTTALAKWIVKSYDSSNETVGTEVTVEAAAE